MLRRTFVLTCTILVLSLLLEENGAKESEPCSDIMTLIKKIIKPKCPDDTSEEVTTKKPKTKKFEERMEKYFEEKFPWWPKNMIEDLEATEKPTTKAPLDALVTSYVDFLNNLFKIF
ncbi:unnamed protein product [Leptosia nina]|uniref:Uncharacterized protein n=1 Tax=Leptosia nina TaxID=320188 RepID=A0AAV1JTS5_9NEOP